MINKKITIIGLGYVGLSLASFLGTQTKVVGIDYDKEKLKIIKKGQSHFHEPKINYYLKKAIKNGTIFTDKITNEVISSDFVFITVGTPIDRNGKIDLNNIKEVSKSIAKNMKNLKNKPTIIVKSTVIPGTTIEVVKPILEKNNLKESIDFDLLTNPEFLKEGSAMQDTILPHSIVIGGTNVKAIKKLTNLYKSVYRKKQKIVETNNITAEMIKYANNAFLATKISFINSIANICQKLPGTNIDKVADIIGTDPRIGRQFLQAGPGYGGSCFPKDVQALINFSNNIGYNPILLDAVKNTNIHQVNAVMNLVNSKFKNLKQKKISILGLAFKENTDDIRESRSIKLINLLLKKNCNIFVHDPKAIDNTRLVFKNKITYSNSIKEVLINSDCVIIMTAWEEYKKLKEKDFLNMQNPLILDTRRILNIKNKKIQYIGLGVG